VVFDSPGLHSYFFCLTINDEENIFVMLISVCDKGSHQLSLLQEDWQLSLWRRSGPFWSKFLQLCFTDIHNKLESLSLTQYSSWV